MVASFWIIKTYYIVVIHAAYGPMPCTFYFGTIAVSVLVPLIFMVIARIVLGFIELLQQNQELSVTIQNILQVFPEGVLVQSIDDSAGGVVVQFANDVAKQKIV